MNSKLGYAEQTECDGKAESSQIKNLTRFAEETLKEQRGALLRLSVLRDRLLGSRPECDENGISPPVSGSISELANVLDASRSASSQIHALIDELSDL